MIFHQPSMWFLLLLLLVPVLSWRMKRRTRAAMRFSSVDRCSTLPRTWRVRLRWIPEALRVLSMVLLIIALARPQKPNESAHVFTEGIAIELIVDRSGSMRHTDFALGGRRVSRLDAALDVLNKFVAGDETLDGRINDLVGLIAFATFADSICPLTLDHEFLLEGIQQIHVATTDEEGRTAIGDAVGLGVERMKGLEERLGVDADRRIKSKIIVLLTDGAQNVGEIDSLTSAEMAAAFGIKIYTIGLAPRGAQDLDKKTLRGMADMTGGKYFSATNTRMLNDVYKTIDDLERTEIERQKYAQFAELAVESVNVNMLNLPPLLPIATGLMLFSVLLARTVFRVIP